MTEESAMFAATCTTCQVHQLLWLELVTELRKTSHGHQVRFVCPRCRASATTEIEFKGRPAPLTGRWRREVIRSVAIEGTASPLASSLPA